MTMSEADHPSASPEQDDPPNQCPDAESSPDRTPETGSVSTGDTPKTPLSHNFEEKEKHENEDDSDKKDNSEKDEENELKWTEDDSLLLEEEDFESIADKSPSQIEWFRRKREENQQNEPLDRVMCMIGHEEVKAYFLSIMDKVKLLKRWNKNLNDWSFDLVLKGVYGPGRNRIAQLYAEFLHSVGVVHSLQFAINEGYSPSSQDSMATVRFTNPMS